MKFYLEECLFMNCKYDLILADPPWRQSKGGKKKARPHTSGTELDYPTMSLYDIGVTLQKFMKLGAPNHNFFLWTIDKHLRESEQMMFSNGYKLHARMIWNKVTGIPAAFTIRYGHEYLLWFYKEKLLPVASEERGKIHSVFTEQVKKHSQKPEVAYEILERLYPNAKKLELFARQKRENWDIWGNELPNDIEL